MNEGDVILTVLNQSDGTSKTRPAVVLREMPLFGDLLVCGVSRQLQQEIKDFVEIVSPADTDYASSGLVSASLIRLGFLAMLPRKQIPGVIGNISSERHQRLLNDLVLTNNDFSEFGFQLGGGLNSLFASNGAHVDSRVEVSEDWRGR